MKSTVSLGAAFGGNPGSHSRKGIDFCRSIARFEDPQNLSPARQPEDAAQSCTAVIRGALWRRGHPKVTSVTCAWIASLSLPRTAIRRLTNDGGSKLANGAWAIAALRCPLLSGYTLACFNAVLRFNRVRMAVTHFARVRGSCLGLLHRRMNRPPFNGKGAPYIRRGSRLPGS